jgi:hypothetical protein
VMMMCVYGFSFLLYGFEIIVWFSMRSSTPRGCIRTAQHLTYTGHVQPEKGLAHGSTAKVI